MTLAAYILSARIGRENLGTQKLVIDKQLLWTSPRITSLCFSELFGCFDVHVIIVDQKKVFRKKCRPSIVVYQGFEKCRLLTKMSENTFFLLKHIKIVVKTNFFCYHLNQHTFYPRVQILRPGVQLGQSVEGHQYPKLGRLRGGADKKFDQKYFQMVHSLFQSDKTTW